MKHKQLMPAVLCKNFQTELHEVRNTNSPTVRDVSAETNLTLGSNICDEGLEFLQIIYVYLKVNYGPNTGKIYSRTDWSVN